MKKKLIILFTACLTLNYASIHSQSYLFTESENSKGTTQGPFTGSSLSTNFSDNSVKFNLNSDSIGLIKIKGKKLYIQVQKYQENTGKNLN